MSRERIVEVLAGHHKRMWAGKLIVGCFGCDWVDSFDGETPSDDLHRAHVADVLTNVLADVWDEGNWHDCRNLSCQCELVDDFGCESNPYRRLR